MAKANENTVSAVNQMQGNSLVYYLGNPNAKTRLLILGNSITRHAPKAEIGWEYDFGMAASKAENDYVHRLYRQIEADGKDVFIMVRQASEWERRYFDEDILSAFEEERRFQADVVLYRLGENVLNPVNQELFFGKLKEFTQFLCAEKTRLLLTTCNLSHPPVDACIERLAKEGDYPCVPLGWIGDDPALSAKGLFWHEGVQMHPSDAGMKATAETIYKILKELL